MPRKSTAAVKETPPTGGEPQAPAVRTEKLPARVTVACKIHVATFRLDLCVAMQVEQQGQNGPKTVTEFHRTGRFHVIAGMAYPAGNPPEGFPPRPQIVNGYALTHDIPGDFWREWVKQHSRAPYVLSGMIKAYETIGDVKAATDDHKAEISGLEPVMRKKVDGKDTIVDPRGGKSQNVQIQGVQAGER
jgi:hypothetical protein